MLTIEQNKALGELYRLIKQRYCFISRAKAILEKKYSANILNQLINKDMVSKSLNRICLTTEGLVEAKVSYRKQAVFKTFCQEILGLSQKETDDYINKHFSLIDDFLLEKFCALIGHAQKDIPQGTCCERAKAEVSDKIISLSQLPVNTSSTVVYIKTFLKPTMLKLFELGLLPGRTLRIHQLYPTYILIVDQNEVAIEPELAELIFVKK